LCEPLHWQVIKKLAITTGMRRSELLGLEFKHFDLGNRVVHVRQALTYSKKMGFFILNNFTFSVKMPSKKSRKKKNAILGNSKNRVAARFFC